LRDVRNPRKTPVVNAKANVLLMGGGCTGKDMLDSRDRKNKKGEGVAAEKQKTPVGIPRQGSESPNEGDGISIVPFFLPSLPFTPNSFVRLSC
jgi:hypothetical protein